MEGQKLANIGLACLLGVIVAGCSAESETTVQPVETASPLFVLSPDGVGPLNAQTPFNLVKIGDAFQDYNVAEETHFMDGEKYPVITVRQQVKPLLSINADYQQKNIFSVVVHDKSIGNKLGHTLGMRFVDIYPAGQLEQCALGMDEWANKVLCYAPKSTNILYVFAGPVEGVMDKVPPPANLVDWTLDAMVWKAPPRS